MKKLLLSLGTIAAIAAPVASVIACGTTNSNANQTFKDASTEQVAALKDLGTTIAGQSSLDLDGMGTIAKTEIKEDEVRFTINPPSTSDFTSITRITVSFTTNKITMVEREVNGDFHDNTSSIKDLEEVSLSIKGDITEAKEALDKVDVGSDSKPITVPGVAVLESLKKLNIESINTSNLSDEDKTAAIAKVNNTKSVADLTEVMKEIAKQINDAMNQSGSVGDAQVSKLNAIIGAKGYSIDANDENLDGELAKLFKSGPDSSLTLVKAFVGIAGDDGHGDDDFAFAISNGDRTVLTAASSSADANELGSGTYASNWGFTDAELGNANLLVFAQTTPTGTTIEVYNIAETVDGALFAHGGTKDISGAYNPVESK